MLKPPFSAPLFVTAMILLGSIYAQAAVRPVTAADRSFRFTGIVTDDGGHAVQMTLAKAKRYCSEHGARLPSARELAQLAVSSGAKGFMKNCGLDHQCDITSAINADGSRDVFYFDYSGYQKPDGETGLLWFWSSSSSSYDPELTLDFNSYSGLIFETNHDETKTLAVRCVVDRPR